ncbi:hypothetical protein CFP65_2648 [Kitasatospora sp. MMS16-BH015]|uniref:WXG100 family type VII secretion target n=1 Tax=Kitasatospora sp. MMS16-BH015 TaxID=2018025 RepID=UPI000CA27230|nr:hypothetical protein [Kitasatospora sp. MMS16-BH015]AUG77470.1 hypothetical protein CFP65_2648 [Kitasatospora sp. MMS16-BH015]
MSTGSGSSGGPGAGYRVEVDGLRAFAGQVRKLLDEFQAHADGGKAHIQSGVGRSAFGTFAEAQTLHEKYETMRDGLRDVLFALHDAIDEAQRKADLTATNYEEQEHETSRHLKVASDGWSVGNPNTVTPTTYTTAVRPTTTVVTGPVSSPKDPGAGTPPVTGTPNETW